MRPIHLCASLTLSFSLVLTGACDRAPPEPITKKAPPLPIPPPAEFPVGGEADGKTLRCPEDLFQPLRPVWFTFSDADLQGAGEEACESGTSTSVLEDTPVAHPPGTCMVNWSGTVTDQYRHAFSGIGAETWTRDWSLYRGMVLQTRGSGLEVRLELLHGFQRDSIEENDCQDRNQDYYGSSLQCGNGKDEWTRHEIEFSKLSQNGWGHSLDFDPTDIAQLQIQTVDRPIAAFQCELYVSEWLLREPPAPARAPTAETDSPAPATPAVP